MADETGIVHVMRERQRAMRREMDRRGLSLKIVAADARLSYSTVQSYFPNAEGLAEPAILPATAIDKLTKALPSDVLSMLLPDGWQIVRVPEQIDHDTLCQLAQDYVQAKAAAHCANSECGVEIGPNEREALDGKVVQLRGGAAA